MLYAAKATDKSRPIVRIKRTEVNFFSMILPYKEVLVERVFQRRVDDGAAGQNVASDKRLIFEF